MLAACKALRPFHIFGHPLSRTFRAIISGDTVSEKMISLHNFHTTHTVQGPPAARDMYENRTTSANFTSHRFAGPVRCPKFQWGREVTIEISMLNVSDSFMQFILTLILYVGILALGAYYGHHPKSFGNDFLTLLSGDVTKHILIIYPQFILEGPCPLFSCLLVSTPWTSLWLRGKT